MLRVAEQTAGSSLTEPIIDGQSCSKRPQSCGQVSCLKLLSCVACMHKSQKLPSLQAGARRLSQKLFLLSSRQRPGSMAEILPAKSKSGCQISGRPISGVRPADRLRFSVIPAGQIAPCQTTFINAEQRPGTSVVDQMPDAFERKLL